MFRKLIFKWLPLEKKLQYLKNNGKLIGSRIREKHTITIYMVSDFFVEVMFAGENFNNPLHIHIFSNLQQLNTYLEAESRSVLSNQM